MKTIREEAPASSRRSWLRGAGILLPPATFIAANAVFVALFRFVHMDTVIRIAYDANTLVLPALFLCAAIALYSFPRDKRYRRPKIATVWIAVAALLVGMRIHATHVEPHRLQVREVTIATGKTTRPFTLLHISDIQSAGIGPYEEQVFARIRALDADLIVHTGDFLQPTGNATYHTELPKLVKLIATLDPPLGFYAVLGESDMPLAKAAPAGLEGVRFLQTEAVEIHPAGAHIRLFGLSLAHTRTRHQVPLALLEQWLSKAPPAALNIVLGHRPDYITRLLDLPFDLCLAGHTHGGQVRVPFYGAIVTSSGAPRDWARGYREIGQTRINVSAGIGAGHNKGLPSIRINCPPEMTLFHIVPLETVGYVPQKAG